MILGRTVHSCLAPYQLGWFVICIRTHPRYNGYIVAREMQGNPHRIKTDHTMIVGDLGHLGFTSNPSSNQVIGNSWMMQKQQWGEDKQYIMEDSVPPTSIWGALWGCGMAVVPCPYFPPFPTFLGRTSVDSPKYPTSYPFFQCRGGNPHDQEEDGYVYWSLLHASQPHSTMTYTRHPTFENFEDIWRTVFSTHWYYTHGHVKFQTLLWPAKCMREYPFPGILFCHNYLVPPHFPLTLPPHHLDVYDVMTRMQEKQASTDFL